MAQQNAENLVWIDLEMTGLNPEVDKIIEIATIITDKNLNLIKQGPVFAIHQPSELLESMDDWNLKHHGQSGLIQRVSVSKVNQADAMHQTLEFIKDYIPQGASPLCGNSIAQDRRFLRKYMPELDAYFHYRNIDVSTIKELVRRWAPDIAKAHHKANTHQALEDIKESISELRFYRDKVFII